MTPVPWDRDLLPEHLWIASLRELAPLEDLFKPFYAFMDAFDEFWEGDTPAMGLLSDFAHLGAKQGEFQRKHETLIGELFLKPFGRILAFFPDSPASWLVGEDFLDRGGHLDPDTEIPRLRRLVVDLLDGRGELATAVRMASFGRVLKGGKIHFSRDMPVVEQLPRYPRNCNADERALVESLARSAMLAYMAAQERYQEHAWARYFWRHNYDLVSCRPLQVPVRGSKPLTEDESLDLADRLASNAKVAREYLDRLALQLKYDLYAPEKGEILHGLFARSVRLFLLVVESPQLWARDTAGIFLRCLAETAITFGYLAKTGSEDDFRRFREHGEAQKKLLMLQLQDTHAGEESLEGRTAEDLSDELGGFSAEILQIELGHWAKKDTRRLAREAGLERYYRLVFTPTSADVHGTWASLKDSNLCICAEPLHRFHQLPTYAEPPLFVGTLDAVQGLLKAVLELAKDTLGYPEGMEMRPLVVADANAVEGE